MQAQQVSTGQLRMIYGLSKKANMDNDALHDMAKAFCGVSSLKELSIAQAGRVIDRLNALVTGKPKPVIVNRATAAQQNKIYAQAREMGWMDEPKRLRGFLEARFKASDVRFLTPDQAGKVIEALKRMREEGRAERKQ